MENLVAKQIEKEEVENLVFPSQPIKLRTPEEQKALLKKLHDAEKLGKIYFTIKLKSFSKILRD